MHDNNHTDCPHCAGIAYRLGRLARLTWFRCKACGIEFNLPAEELNQ